MKGKEEGKKYKEEERLTIPKFRKALDKENFYTLLTIV